MSMPLKITHAPRISNMQNANHPCIGAHVSLRLSILVLPNNFDSLVPVINKRERVRCVRLKKRFLAWIHSNLPFFKLFIYLAFAKYKLICINSIYHIHISPTVQIE